MQRQSNTDRFVFASVVVRVGRQRVALTTLNVRHIANAGEFGVTILTRHQCVKIALDAGPRFFHVAGVGSSRS